MHALRDNARMNSDFDIVIVGGGLAGLALAVALRASRLSVAVVEERTPPAAADAWDTRIYAVSPGNARFLDEIGIWTHLDTSRIAPVRAMEIFGDAGGRLDFSAYDSGVGELAWIVEASLMQRELWETVKRQHNVTLLCPERPQALDFGSEVARLTLEGGTNLTTRLIVAADGADSWTRQAAGIEVTFQPYEQMGVVANFVCSKPHDFTACQWFRSDGILAYLPLPGNRFSMVWSTPDAHALELLSLSVEEFASRVAEAGEWRFGELSLMTPPAAFPLRLMRAPRTIAPRLALIGDAAHTIHPLSGHGINLGFKDAQALAMVLAERPDFVDCGDTNWLRRYERTRIEEVVALQSATHALQRLFQPQSMALVWLRNSGLNLTNALPVIRNGLARYALD
jgi:ubiquinone biosynthesis UbiH/UbiF/VisC/COQ6 family hydroxylase